MDLRTKYSKIKTVSRDLIQPEGLSRLTHHRWALPALAELHALGGGAKFVQVVNRLGGHRLAVEQAIETLCELGLVMPNPGYGHPLRPEYVLTAAGTAAGPACARVMQMVRSRGLEDVAGRKWALPTVLALKRGAERFGEVRRALGSATDRAISITLGDLGGARMVSQRAGVEDARAVLYALRTAGKELGLVVGEVPRLVA